MTSHRYRGNSRRSFRLDKRAARRRHSGQMAPADNVARLYDAHASALFAFLPSLIHRIAETLEIPLNTAASRYRYGLDKLRERLRPYENPPAPRIWRDTNGWQRANALAQSCRDAILFPGCVKSSHSTTES